MAFDLGGESVERGEGTWISVDVARDADLSSVTLHLRVVNGQRDGPVLWLQAGVHGNEPVGSLSVRDYALSLDPAVVSGTVVALPVGNPSAFANKQRGSQIHHIGSDDLNSVFPGDEDGSFSQRLADVIFSLVHQHADYVVSAHSADEEVVMDTAFAYVPITGSGRAVDTETRSIAAVCPVSHLIERQLSQVQGFLSGELVQKDIPSVIVEAGGGARVDEWAYETYRNSFENVARHVDLLSGKPEQESSATVSDDLAFLTADSGGFVETTVEGGDTVTEGDDLATISGLRGRSHDTIAAPFDGTVLAVRSYPHARPGDLVVEMTSLPEVQGFSSRPG